MQNLNSSRNKQYGNLWKRKTRRGKIGGWVGSIGFGLKTGYFKRSENKWGWIGSTHIFQMIFFFFKSAVTYYSIPSIKNNITTYFEILIFGLHVLYVFNTHIKFRDNWMLFILQSINLFFIHNFRIQNFEILTFN